MKSLYHLPFGLLLSISLAGLALAPAQATQPIFTLHSFNGNDGARPKSALVQDASGNLYGSASEGGANNSGVIYKITPAGAYSTLYEFSALVNHPGGGITDPAVTNADGAHPAGLAVASDGTLYGATQTGGANGNGTLFKIAPGQGLVTLHTFERYTLKNITVPGGSSSELVNTDGAQPAGLTLGPDGNLYGVARYGGANGNGAFYRLTPAGGFTTLHNFSAFTWLQPIPVEQQTDLVNTDGANPEIPLVLAPNGSFYGVAPWGGPSGRGTIFNVTTSGALSVLYGLGGGYMMRVRQYVQGLPTVGTVSAIERYTVAPGSDGNLYGTTSGKATDTRLEPRTDYGTLFRLTSGGAFATLHTFGALASNDTNADGAEPMGGLAPAPNGHLYGTTSAGGENAQGTIFDLAPGGAVNTLYSFGGFDGADVEASLMLGKDGNLYGTAVSGGAYQKGVVFIVSPNPPPFVLYTFDGTNGFDPVAIMQAKDGNFYGVNYSTTTRGIGDGNVFRIVVQNDVGTLTSLHDFPYARPDGALIQASDGALYGGTSWGAIDGDHIFRITTAGQYSLLFDFANKHDADGGTPYRGVIQAGDGNFYGTNAGAGPGGSGVLFRLTPSGVITVLHAFSYTAPEGYDSETALLQASDGFLYGVSNRGGVSPNSADGVIWRSSLDGNSFQVLHQFDPNKENINPFDKLVEGADGYLYGVTRGIYSQGGIYRLPKTASQPGDLQSVHNFDNSEGGQPTGLVRASDGNFYGLLGTGGSTITGGSGSVFKLTPTGEFTIIHRFHGYDGGEPFYAPLVEGNDGNLYGVSEGGGPNGYGVFFRVAIARPGASSTPTNTATNVTGQVQVVRAGFAYNNATKRFFQVVTIKNTGAAIAGPVSLVLDNLSANAALFNKTGLTSATIPAGSPYINVTAGNLGAGASVSVTLQFTNPTKKGITYAVRVLAGAGAR